jgi:hypothetical protein
MPTRLPSSHSWSEAAIRCRLILGLGSRWYCGNEARIVNVGVRKNQLLSDAQFEAVSEHLRPYLAQLVT